MSEDRNYRAYLKKYHGTESEGDVIKGLSKFVNPAKHGEREMRQRLSKAIGENEESTHKTFQDETTGQRRNAVPASCAQWHNKLTDAAYAALHDPALDAEAV